MSSLSSVDKVPAQCSVGQSFDPCRGQYFSVPSSCHVDPFTFQIITKLKICIFIHTRDDFDGADLSSMQDTCHMNSIDLTFHKQVCLCSKS